jgi:DeoR family transcriptional regulator, glycerol-3-phosphate regulon repressor
LHYIGALLLCGEKYLMAKKKYNKRERQQHIVTAIASSASVSVSRLSAKLDVSKQTVRRDLDELSLEGRINRTHGGAAVRFVGLEPDINERSQYSNDERVIIADLATDLITDGEVVMLGAGLTPVYVAQSLVSQFNRLHVITNNLSAGSILASNPGIHVVMAPGDFQFGENCVCGAETLAFLKKFRADVAIFGASGFSGEGPSDCHSGIAWVDRMMLQQSTRKILVADHTKSGVRNVELVCTLDEIDAFVTDRIPESKMLEKLEASEVQLVSPDLVEQLSETS